LGTTGSPNGTSPGKPSNIIFGRSPAKTRGFRTKQLDVPRAENFSKAIRFLRSAAEDFQYANYFELKIRRLLAKEFEVLAAWISICMEKTVSGGRTWALIFTTKEFIHIWWHDNE
jgi:hypothetical protein